MKSSILIFSMLGILSISAFSQNGKDENLRSEKLRIIKKSSKCPSNSDRLYNRQQILEKLAALLNRQIPGFRDYEAAGFEVTNERPTRFFVFDLTDTANKATSMNNCIQFIDMHVYHVAPVYIPYSFSYVVILEKGLLTTFEAINCDNSHDKLEDVKTFIERFLPRSKVRKKLIARLKDYRTYGIYFTIDDTQLKCNERNTK